MITAQMVRKQLRCWAAALVVCATLCLSTAQESNSAAAPKRAFRSLGDLVSRIAVADCVVVTNWCDGIHRSTSGDEARRIIQEVSSSTRFPPHTPPPTCIACWQLHFFSGTNCVATNNFCDGIFWLGDGMYAVSGKALCGLFEEMQQTNRAARLRRDEERWFAAARDKEEARQWLTNASHTLFMEREKVLGFVGELYQAGASNVFIHIANKDNALIVVLPQELEARRKVFAVETRHGHEWLPNEYPDLGQKYLWYGFR